MTVTSTQGPSHPKDDQDISAHRVSRVSRQGVWLADLVSTVSSLEQQPSWTDDLPLCHLSGVGSAPNRSYSADGKGTESHPPEDSWLKFRSENNCFLYGVFNGYDGNRVTSFVAQRLSAELLLGQLSAEHTEADVRRVLLQAFDVVERSFLESIDDALAEKASLQSQLPEGVPQHQLPPQYQKILERLKALEREISGGAMAVVAVLLNSKLYVANVDLAQLLEFSCRYKSCPFMQIHGGRAAGDTAERGPHHGERGRALPPLPAGFGRRKDQAGGGHLWAGEHQAHRGLQGQIWLHGHRPTQRRQVQADYRGARNPRCAAPGRGDWLPGADVGGALQGSGGRPRAWAGQPGDRCHDRHRVRQADVAGCRGPGCGGPGEAHPRGHLCQWRRTCQILPEARGHDPAGEELWLPTG
ncbi:TGF-beta-activated kinase 1 and MAP3K7-binding protein 1 isoform X4 [Ursus arctos]|uniref:TGF-beta-activated kinase 1 and MAP3K7-binding protein 1 isoform X4 n=1 Tax=Ursus arctos TaxID=9644 RepID=UPI001CF92290|nr:TGF-beta-activated kinase 1 and MAP3K7-binding protein 1 isoform X4 [Ursus arctos]